MTNKEKTKILLLCPDRKIKENRLNIENGDYYKTSKIDGKDYSLYKSLLCYLIWKKCSIWLFSVIWFSLLHNWARISNRPEIFQIENTQILSICLHICWEYQISKGVDLIWDIQKRGTLKYFRWVSKGSSRNYIQIFNSIWALAAI